jgi:hypothetical protein
MTHKLVIFRTILVLLLVGLALGWVTGVAMAHEISDDEAAPLAGSAETGGSARTDTLNSTNGFAWSD